MNPNIVNELTVVAGVAGYAAGLVADELAVRRAAKLDTEMNEAWAIAADATDESEPRMRRLASRVGNLAVTPLALAGSVALALNMYAWVPEASADEQSPPTLEVVVDHSGATGLAIGGEPVVNQINKVVSQFVKVDNLKVEAIVSSSGTETAMRINKVATSEPFGVADLPAAMNLALSRASELAPVQANGESQASAGVLLITNGNSAGKTKSVVTKAQQNQVEAGVTTPIFVVNVEGAKASQAVTDDLKAIAKKTGASYWAADTDNLASVAKDVRETIVNDTNNDSNGSDKTPVKILGIVGVLGIGSLFRSRRNMPFGRGLKGV